MKAWRSAMLGLLAAAAVPGAAQAQTQFETQVLAALNAVRADPAAFAGALQTFRTYFRGVSYAVPGAHLQMMTNEGVGAVDGAIAFLKDRQGMGSVAPAPLLKAAADDHVAEQAGSGAIGHQGADGSSPGDRVLRRGGGGHVAEVIQYGARDPVDVVRQLIVDDGVANRGHRAVLLDPNLRFAGVSCGPHPIYRTMCVIDLDARRDGRAGVEVAAIQ